jgi:16S rRNA (cytidine1402-2'-O)-methyltransferase
MTPPCHTAADPGAAEPAARRAPAGTGGAGAPGQLGRLFVVATPIGHLGDITLRALDTLRSVRLVAAEDTRRTAQLLRHYQIQVPLLSYHEHNRRERLPRLLAELQAGDVALVSDAGTPGISDPGQELVAAAAGAGHQVVPIPGPSAIIAAVAVAGLPAEPFHFAGFLPRRPAQRRAHLQSMATWPGLIVLFEAPHRLRPSLADLADVLGDRPVVVCSELTKLFENVLRTTLSQAVEYFRHHEPRGEFTLVVGGAASTPAAGVAAAAGAGDATARRQRFEALCAALGDRRRALAALAAETGLPRKRLYAELISRRAC